MDDAGQPVPAGTTGRILVTLLHNRRFPLIRYEIGDIGALSSAKCQCGSPLPLLERVEGRVSEIITGANGAYVSPVYIRHLIGVVHNPGTLGKFQFVQSGAAEFALAMQMDAEFPNAEFEKVAALIRRDLEKVFGSGAQIAIRRVNDIPLSDGGKFQYVRNLHHFK